MNMFWIIHCYLLQPFNYHYYSLRCIWISRECHLDVTMYFEWFTKCRFLWKTNMVTRTNKLEKSLFSVKFCNEKFLTSRQAQILTNRWIQCKWFSLKLSIWLIILIHYSCSILSIYLIAAKQSFWYILFQSFEIMKELLALQISFWCIKNAEYRHLHW